MESAGFQQQLPVCCSDAMEAWQHAQAGAGSHEGAAHRCRQSRRRHPPGGTCDYGAARWSKVGEDGLTLGLRLRWFNPEEQPRLVLTPELWRGVCRIEELTCGGMVEQVQEAFGETMTSVVSLCARYPIACANSIGLLCTIPYTR